MSKWIDSEKSNFSAVEPRSIWRGAEILQASKQSTHILKDRIVAGEVTAIYGPPKSGKTHVAVNLALAAACGLEFWGQKFSDGGAPVLYVAAERHSQVALRIIAASKAQGLSSPPENLSLHRGSGFGGLSSAEFQEELARRISDMNPSMVIFDTYARIAENNEDSARDATENVTVMENLVRLSGIPCAAVVIHHSGKDRSKGMRGSSALFASVTTLVRVSSKDNVIFLTMEAANDFDTCPPQIFHIEEVSVPHPSGVDGFLQIGIASPKRGDNASDARRNEILRLWSGTELKWRNLKEIQTLLEEAGNRIPGSTLSKVLIALCDEGRLEKQKWGKAFTYRPPVDGSSSPQAA